MHPFGPLGHAGFWKDRRVVVTGGAGFVGTAVVARLRALGAREVIVPRQAQYDLREREAIRALLADAARGGPIDVVVHLAARVGGIGANRARPAEFFYDNLMMGAQLLHEAWRAGVGKLVAAGTVCAYPRDTPVPFREEDLWNGYPEETNAPYGVAKRALAVQARAYREQYGFDAIVVLPTNVYGPGADADPETSHVVPALIRKCLEATARGDSAVVAWGDGSPTREFLYVDDAAEGLLLAAERYDDAAPVNLGSGVEVSLKALVDTIARLTGFSGRVEWDATRPNGQPRRLLDTSRAERAFGFRARTSLEDGLRRTIEWYRAPQARGLDA
jgi:GDP-L-fucose synthase